MGVYVVQEASLPTYVYRCQQCGITLERRQSFEDPRLTVCEECSGELRRVLQPVQVIFKGSGFYSTDHRTKSFTDGEAKANAANGEAKTSGSDSKAESVPAKTESGPATTESAPAKTEAPATTSSSTESGKSTDSGDH
jgi:putative FmdB family regulatory protein